MAVSERTERVSSLSVVVPVYNSADELSTLVARLEPVSRRRPARSNWYL